MKLAASLAALLAFTSPSHADRKSEPPPDKLAAAAGEAFAKAGKMVFELEETGAQIFVNGEPVKQAKNALELELPAGDYSVDLVTAITYDNRRCSVYHGVEHGCRLSPRPREDGNVIISGPVSMSAASVGRSAERQLQTARRRDRARSRRHVRLRRDARQVARETR